MNNREILIDTMLALDLERRELADLLCVDRETVNRWLLSGESSRHLEVPDMAIELLRLKTGHEINQTDA